MRVIQEYFPTLSENQLHQFDLLAEAYRDWNQKINVISRKDIDNLEIKHFLHSLSIAKYIDFRDGTKVLDAGTGGGLPGLPLAIFFPKVEFHLVDSIGKKIKVVEEITNALGLQNVTYAKTRMEEIKDRFDFAVTRAVAPADQLFRWLQGRIHLNDQNDIHNGVICLKGGNLREEFESFKRYHRFVKISDYFKEEYFENKKIVYIPV